MVDQQTTPDADDEAGKSGGMMKTLMTGAGMFVIVLAATTIAPLITNALGIAPAVVVQTAPADAVEEAEAAPDAPPIYWPLKPALIVNFAGDDETSFLQLELEVMARDQAVIDAVKEHTPALRNALLMMLASVESQQVFTVEGKQALRDAALTELNGVLEPYVGETGLEAVYFTSFVAQ